MINNEFAQVLEPSITGEVVTLGHHLLEADAPIILPGKEQGQGRKGSQGQRQAPGAKP